jgi:hypothetical protein
MTSNGRTAERPPTPSAQPNVRWTSLPKSRTYGVVLILHPVKVLGHKWIGVVLPPGLGPVKAVAYSREAELAHAIPSTTPSLDSMSS